MNIPKARTFSTSEGVFVNIEDVGRAVKDAEYMNEKIVPLLKVGYDQGRPANEILAVIVAAVILETSGQINNIVNRQS